MPTPTPSPEQIPTPAHTLWRGILGRSDWLIQQALQQGADPNQGPDDDIIANYPQANLTPTSHPLTVLAQQHAQWSLSFSTYGEGFKASCKAILAKGRRKYAIPEGQITPLLAYSCVDSRRRKYSTFQQILRRTRPEDLARVDEQGHNALYHNIRLNRIQEIKALCAAGLDPNACDTQGRNALHWETALRGQRPYAKQKNREIIDFLLRIGTRIVADNDGNHILHHDALIPLAAADAALDINRPNAKGETLATVALRQFAWNRWKELLNDPRTDWAAQVPDLGQFIKDVAQRSFSSDKEAPLMYQQIVSLCQQQQLSRQTPQAGMGARKARF